MLFNSYIFILFFFPITLLGYFTLNKYAYGKKGTAGLVWLFLMSLWFYGYEKPIYLLLIGSSIIINYMISRWIYYLKRQKSSKLYLKVAMGLGVLINLAILFYFKYAGFFLDLIDQWFNRDWDVRMALPLGISFFTFQQVSYVVDCYKTEEGVDYSFLEYAAYVAFFPQLVAGPIVMHSELVPQLKQKEKKTINYENMCAGLYAFSLGLSKKVLIADSLSKVVNNGYELLSGMNSATSILVMLAYTLQIYFDFSGYSDMAIGMGKMFNIDLPINFDSPYKSKGIGEFWNRWHKTLNRFFVQYVYIPLGGSRRGKLITYRNTLIIFLLSGIWHGANWTYMLWGVIHGVLLVLEKACKDLGVGIKCSSLKARKVIDVFKVIVTFIIINPTWIVFRSSSIEEAKLYMHRIFAGGWTIPQELTEAVNGMIEVRLLGRLGLNRILDVYPAAALVFGIALLVLAVFLLPNTHEKMGRDKYTWKRTLVTVGLLIWCIVSLSDVSEFMYFNF